MKADDQDQGVFSKTIQRLAEQLMVKTPRHPSPPLPAIKKANCFPGDGNLTIIDKF